jgi:sugar O-acyltransferase (sialic acid O-acetyltransferase NeuD family)
MRDILIFGDGQYAKNIFLFISKEKRYKIKAFVVDRDYYQGEKLFDIPVIPYEDLGAHFDMESIGVVIAVGYTNLNQNREEVYNRLKQDNIHIETYIHTDANVYSNDIGEGCVITAGAVVEPNSNLGKCVVAWSNTVIAHDSTVEDFCWIASGTVVSANCRIGRSTFIGVNSTISNYVEIGKFNFIGAAAIIHKNTNDNNVFLQKPTEEFRLSSQDFIKMGRV